MLIGVIYKKKKIEKNIGFLLFIILIQITVNFFFYEQTLNLKEFGSIIFFFLLYIVTLCEKDRIIKNLKTFSELIITINFLGLIYFYFNDGIRIVDSCNLVLVDNIVFHENSHYAMMTVSIFIYYIFEKINLRNSIFIFLLSLNSLVYLSLTLIVGLIASLLICLIILVIHKINKKKILLMLIFFLSILLLSKNNCTNRITHLVEKTNFDLITVKKNNFDVNTYTKLSEFKELFETKNLSSEVINIAILNTIHTFEQGKIFGWGFNSYNRAYEDNFETIKNKYYPNHDLKYELFTLNKSDARSVLLKIINEFGILSLIFLYFAYKFILNKSVDLKIKSFISSLLVTQLISGAGYFNGGFAVFLFLMIILSNSKQKLRE